MTLNTVINKGVPGVIQSDRPVGIDRWNLFSIEADDVLVGTFEWRASVINGSTKADHVLSQGRRQARLRGDRPASIVGVVASWMNMERPILHDRLSAGVLCSLSNPCLRSRNSRAHTQDAILGQRLEKELLARENADAGQLLDHFCVLWMGWILLHELRQQSVKRGRLQLCDVFRGG